MNVTKASLTDILESVSKRSDYYAPYKQLELKEETEPTMTNVETVPDQQWTKIAAHL